MFENPRRTRQARNFTENDPKILDLKSSSEQIIFRKLSLGAPDIYTIALLPTRKLYQMGLCSFLRTVFCKRDFCNGAKLRRRSDRKKKCLISDSSFCATLWCSVNCEDWSQLRRKWIFKSEDWDLVRLVHCYAVALHTTKPGGFSCPHGCYPLSGGEYFRTFWVGMCRWDPGTLNLYQI